MNKIFTVLIFTALLSASYSVNANYIPKLSLDEKVKTSDIIFIGKVISIDSEPIGKYQQKYAVVKITKSLYGIQGIKQIKVLFDGPISELNPLCCEIGFNYLFMLKKYKDDYYETSNGPYGIYKIDSSYIYGWDHPEYKEKTLLIDAINQIEELIRGMN